MLATGGAAALWRRTTNPWGAIGAGPVLAAAAGADLADLEFCQFHPTALALPGTRFDGLLITEAVRGEGATLLDASGRRFTDELAPRDAVTAAILDRIEADGADTCASTCASVDPARFPNVFDSLRRGRARPRAPSRSRSPPPPTTRWAGSRSTSTAAPRCPASTRSASAPAPACTAPTGSPPTRSASASSSAAAPPAPRSRRAGRRPPAAARVALRAADRGDPRRRLAPRRPAAATPSSCASCSTTPIRSPPRSPTCALERRESRGGHLRADFPGIDPELDGIHIVLGPDGETRREEWR